MLSTRLLLALLLGYQAFLIWALLGDSVVPLCITAIVLTGLVGRAQWYAKKPLRLLAWAMAAIIAVAAQTTSLGNYTDNETYLIAVLAFGELLLFVASFELHQTRSERADLLRMVALVTGFATCLFWQPIRSSEQNLVLAALGEALLLGIVCSSPVGSGPVQAVAAPNRSLRPRLAMSATLLAAVLLLAWQTYELTLRNVPLMQSYFVSNIAARSRSTRTFTGFMRGATLSSVSLEKQTDPELEAFTVFCDVPPGYLRGSAYDVLHESRWFESELGGRRSFRERQALLTRVDATDVVPSSLEQNPNQQFFNLQPYRGNAFLKVEVVNNPRRGRMFFTPPEATLLRGTASEIYMDSHQIVHGGLDARISYTSFIPLDRDLPQPPPKLDTLVQVPSHLESLVQTLASQIFVRKRSTAEKVAAVESYFHRNHRYTLKGFETPVNVDPLSHFLSARPAAHCEFFASGAVMLLRTQGIPARYVTGYTVMNRSRDREIWIARSRDAHAWAEAYDAELGKWIIVEATPGVSVPKQPADRQEQLAAELAQSAASTNSDFISQSTLWGWLQLDANTLAMTAQLLAAVMVGAGFVWLYGQRNGSKPAQVSDPERAKLRELLATVDRRLARVGLQRQANETLSQFARRITTSGDDEYLGQAARWYESLAALLYRKNVSATDLLRMTQAQPVRTAKTRVKIPLVAAESGATLSEV